MHFRMCGYNRDYLKESPSEAGSQKLLHWSAKDVADWVKTIELDEYVGGLQEAGVNGAVMVRLLRKAYVSALELRLVPNMTTS